MTNFLLQGLPGFRDHENPTLVPNFDQNVAVNGIVGAQSPAQYLVNNPRVDATANAILGGSVTNGDTLSLTVTLATLSGGSETVSYKAVTADTITTVAEGLANAINNDGNLGALGIFAEMGGTSEGTQLVLHANGPVGNLAVMTMANSGSSETFLIGSGTTAVANAAGTIVVAGTITTGDMLTATFTNSKESAWPSAGSYVTIGGDNTTLAATGLKSAINANTTLTAQGVAAVSNGSTITITQPGTIANTTTITGTVGGAATETLTVTPGGGVMTGGTGTWSGKLTGGSGPVIAATNFRYSYNGQTSSFWFGKPYTGLGDAMVAAIVADTPNMRGGRSIV